MPPSPFHTPGDRGSGQGGAPLGFRAKPHTHHPAHPCLPQGWGRPSYLDPFDALGDNVGMVHGHQRDLDSSHPAHRACPHSCGQSTRDSALLAPEGMPPKRTRRGAAESALARPPSPRQRPGRGGAWPGHSQHGHSGVSRNMSPTCAVDHTGRLDGAVLGLHSRDPPHPKVIRPHTDAGHWTVLDDLGLRGTAYETTRWALRAPAPPLTSRLLDGPWGHCFC